METKSVIAELIEHGHKKVTLCLTRVKTAGSDTELFFLRDVKGVVLAKYHRIPGSQEWGLTLLPLNMTQCSAPAEICEIDLAQRNTAIAVLEVFISQ
ncbi:hypothetical protein RFI23_004913 [Klebsiella aerogenes]|nr:hypothetical protein [Klebsiella aerogenes]